MQDYRSSITQGGGKVKKSEVIPSHSIEAYDGSKGIAPLIFDLSTLCEWSSPCSSHMTHTAIEYRAGWTQLLVWMFCKKENLIPVPGFEHQTIRPVAS